MTFDVPLLFDIDAALALATLILLAGPRRAWPLEFATHFWPHLIAACGVTAIVGLALMQYGYGAVALGLALINIAAMPTPRHLNPTSAPAGDVGLTVAWANVWKKPDALKRTIEWARAHNADLIMIGEYPATDIIGPAPDYPYVLDTGTGPTDLTYSRIVALSRFPTRDLEVIVPDPANRRPFMKFTLDLPGGAALTVIPKHPPAPMTAAMLRRRDAAIAMLAGLARSPFLIAGDFNATPATPTYADIPGTRVGAPWRTPTWLTNLPLLGLPIDHIKVSAGITASAYRVAPFLGSDHRAVLARLHLPTQKTP